MMRFAPKATQSWHAFRYLAGELNPNDEAAFELRLERDQDTREALAEAVELVQAVRLVNLDARPITPAQTRTVRSRALGWLALAAAACLAVVVGLRGQGENENPSKQSVAHHDDDGPNSTVALTWSGLRLDDDRDWRNDLLGWLDPATSDESDDPPEPEPLTERGLPSWMLEVASLHPTDSPAEGETKEN